mmetsp:Transcript_24734/g.57618  ORF Transcript_24734/g.57618 Transcript_24734/m.57618 type:complete len:217 (+) Transcript_24734:536-1186(+)
MGLTSIIHHSYSSRKQSARRRQRKTPQLAPSACHGLSEKNQPHSDELRKARHSRSIASGPSRGAPFKYASESIHKATSALRRECATTSSLHQVVARRTVPFRKQPRRAAPSCGRYNRYDRLRTRAYCSLSAATCAQYVPRSSGRVSYCTIATASSSGSTACTGSSAPRRARAGSCRAPLPVSPGSCGALAFCTQRSAQEHSAREPAARARCCRCIA